MDGHGLERGLEPAERIAGEHGGQHVRHDAGREREQQEGDEHRGVAGVDEDGLALLVDELAERHADEKEHAGHDEEVDGPRRETVLGGVDGHEVLECAEGEHEHEHGHRRRQAVSVDDRAQVELLSGHVDARGADEREEHEADHGDGGGDGIEHLEAEALHEGKPERRRDGRGEGRGHAEVAHALGEARLADDIGGDRRRGGVREREADAVDHAQGDGQGHHRHEHVSERGEAHEHEPDHEGDPADSVVEPPAHEGSHDDRDEREDRGADARNGLRATEALDEEREGGEAHDVVRKHAEVHEDDEDEVAGPEPRPGPDVRGLPDDCGAAF